MAVELVTDNGGDNVLHLSHVGDQISRIRLVFGLSGVELIASQDQEVTALKLELKPLVNSPSPIQQPSAPLQTDLQMSQQRPQLQSQLQTCSRETSTHEHVSVQLDVAQSVSINKILITGMSTTSMAITPPDINNDSRGAEDEWLKKMRGWLMVVAVLIVSVTYQAGLNPPGGFWQDDKEEKPQHVAGNAILEDKNPRQFFLFRIFNTMAMAQSLAIILLLMRGRVFHGKNTLDALQILVLGSIVSLTGAYTYGYASHTTISISVTYLVVSSVFVAEFLVWFQSSGWTRFRLPSCYISRLIPKSHALLFLRLFVVAGIVAFSAVVIVNEIPPASWPDIPLAILLVLGVVLWWFRDSNDGQQRVSSDSIN